MCERNGGQQELLDSPDEQLVSVCDLRHRLLLQLWKVRDQQLLFGGNEGSDWEGVPTVPFESSVINCGNDCLVYNG